LFSISFFRLFAEGANCVYIHKITEIGQNYLSLHRLINKHTILQIIRFTFAISLVVMLFSCRSIEQFSIEYMVPADVSFPPQLKSIAVVNNVSGTPGSNLSKPVQEIINDKGVTKKIIHSGADAALAAASFANRLAETNYFNEVIICDSALRAKDVTPHDHTLSKKEINTLVKNLGVDALFALENLQIKSVHTTTFIPEIEVYYGTLDVTVYPTVRVYLPERNGPMVTINASDSIFWEKFDYSLTSVMPVISDEQIIKEAMNFAGSIPVKHLVPYWKTANRYIYTNGSTEMRDAAICVRNNEWAKAHKFWQQASLSNKKKLQMYSAWNIAIYHEMNDSIKEAIVWATKAQELARKIGKTDESVSKETTNGFFISIYLTELNIREENLPKLNMQMQRFKKDF
jgi:hypothetical protein